MRGSGVKLDCDLYPAAGILQSNQIAELHYYVTSVTRSAYSAYSIMNEPVQLVRMKICDAAGVLQESLAMPT